MKRNRIVLLSILAVLLLLILTKPSKQRVKEDFLSRGSTAAIKDIAGNVNIDKALEYGRDNADKYISVKDYLLFMVVSTTGIKDNRVVGIGVLNTTIPL